MTGATAPGAAIRYLDSPIEQLRDLVRLEWDAMSEWLEEDEIVYTHPRDPYTRVDILPSSRHVRVEIDGIVVAESQPASAPLRDRPADSLLPADDGRADGPPATVLVAVVLPVQGHRGVLHLETPDTIKPDVAWIYRTPLPESQKVAGLVGFYNERVDIVRRRRRP